MSVYRWSGAESAANYVGKTAADDRKICWDDDFRGEPLPGLNNWEVPLLTQYLGDRQQQKPRVAKDCATTSNCNLVSARAAELLSDMWDRNAILYPVRLEDRIDETYYMVVVDNVLDCLDREASTGKLQEYGDTPDLFAYVEKWVFDEGCIGDTELFVLPDSPTMVYVTDTFKSRIEETGLHGFCLRESFWDPDPFLS